jgi:uncharacterized protein (DUF1697 family)
MVAATRRYAALLRGVSPMNAKMPELKRCFEATGFTDVRTVLASGNVVFTARAGSEAAIARRAEDAMARDLDRGFLTIVRSLDALRALLDADPYAAYRLAPGSKRVVTFLRDAPAARLALPIELDGARILGVAGREVFSAYVPGPRGPVFMKLIEKTYGDAVTTRTWDTVRKLAADPPAPRPAKPRTSAPTRRR